MYGAVGKKEKEKEKKSLNQLIYPIRRVGRGMIQLSVVACKKIRKRLTCYSSIINRSHNTFLDWGFISWPARGRISICKKHSPQALSARRPVMAGLVQAKGWLGSEGNSAGPGIPSALSIPLFQQPPSLAGFSVSGQGRQLI